MIHHKRLIFVTMLTAFTMHIHCGSAATLLATTINPVGGGTISQSGSYYLGWDVGITAPPALITISASDVILDMNWHLLNGNIVIDPGVQHVEILNGYIDATDVDTSTPALAIGTNGGTTAIDIQISDMTIRNSPQNGIQAINVNDLFITDVLVQRDPSIQLTGGGNIGACMLQQVDTAYVKNSVFVGYVGDNMTGGFGFLGESIVVGSDTIYNTNVVIENCTGISNAGNFQIVGTQDNSGAAYIDCHSLSAPSANPAIPFTTVGFENLAGNAEYFNCISDFASNTGFNITIVNPGDPLTDRPLLKQCFAQNTTGSGSNIGFSFFTDAIAQGCISVNNGTGFFSNTTPSEGTTSRFVNNFAYDNATNYSPADGLDPFQPVNTIQTGSPVAQWWRNTYFAKC